MTRGGRDCGERGASGRDGCDPPEPRSPAAAIRDAIAALERSRPDLAERLRVLLGELERGG